MTFTGILDEYQRPAKTSFIDRGSLLIAYSMGLGKTPIAIASAEELREAGKISTCLIVCPASLKYQWAQKISEFTNVLSYSKKVGSQTIFVPEPGHCVLIDGDKQTRERLYAPVVSGKHRPNYIIIGYDNVLNDYAQIGKIKAQMVVLDEATAIKNFKAQRSKRIKKLLRAEFKLALTGTPIENKPEELFSIMQWVDESVLGRYDLFEKAYINRNKFGWIVSYKNLPVLRKKVAPAIARLTADDRLVKKFMPAVKESAWIAYADEQTNDLYKLIAEDMLAEMDKLAVYQDFNLNEYYLGMGEDTPSGKLMGMYACLEMLTNHPDLLVWSALQYKEGKNQGSKYAYNLWQEGLLDNILFSPKLDRLQLGLALEPSNKVLIYSKYKYMLQIIHVNMTLRQGQSCVQHHGSMSPIKKAESIAKFRNDDECRYFLSSHSGAYGLDMNMADVLINYDLPWSAGKQDQINSRHRRRSSEFDTVYVYNLVLGNSFEERRLRVLDRKKRLASSILDGVGADKGGKIILEGDSLRQHLTSVLQHGIME